MSLTKFSSRIVRAKCCESSVAIGFYGQIVGSRVSMTIYGRQAVDENVGMQIVARKVSRVKCRE